MDFSQLKTFVAVAHHGHLTQAAETLHLSQPAVTAKIKSLEKSLELELFVRNAQGMQLTLAGQSFLPAAEKLLQEVHRLNAFAQEIAKEDMIPLNIGMTSAVRLPFLAQALQAFRQAVPHVFLQILEDIGGNVLNQVRKKELLAGVYIGEVPYRNVMSQVIGEQEYCLIAPKKWQDELQDKNALQKKPWLCLSDFTSGSKAAHRFFQQERIKPKIVMNCDNLHTLIWLVAEGAGLALVPKQPAMQAQEDGIGIILMPAFQLSEPIQFIYHMEFELDPILIALKDSLNNLA